MSGTKTTDNSQWGLATSDGTRATGLKPPAVDGHGIEPVVDLDGRVWTRDGLSPIDPALGVIRYDNAGAFAGQGIALVAVLPLTLLRIFGFKTGANVEYIQLYDLAAGPPAGVPFAQFAVPQDGDFSLDFGVTGRPLTTGLVVALSTSAVAFVAAGATMWLNAELV